MKVGWLADRPGYTGGAEMTQAEFRAAAPVEVVDCRPGEVVPGLDLYVVHNVTSYGPDDLAALRGATVYWYHHDLTPWIVPPVRAWLDQHASHIFCSPIQRDRYGVEGVCIPPPLDIEGLSAPENDRRAGTCSIAQWRAPSKGARYVEEWARDNGGVAVYGDGPFFPEGPGVTYCGALAPEKVGETLRMYERFVFLPFDIEPFGRCVAEAWAAGCKIVTNRLVGALHWIENEPAGLENATERFWEEVL